MTNNKKKNTKLRGISLFMEKFWLALAIISFLAVAYIYISEGEVTRQTAQYLVFPFLAGLMYAFRTIFRKRMEKHEDL